MFQAGVTTLLWTDLYHDVATDGWFVRVGRAVNTDNLIQHVTIGNDVLVQYRIPNTEPALDVSHIALNSNLDVQATVCTDSREGKPYNARACADFGHCSCRWKEPINWEDIECDTNCGLGEKTRYTYCMIDVYEGDSVACEAQGMEGSVQSLVIEGPGCSVLFWDDDNMGEPKMEGHTPGPPRFQFSVPEGYTSMVVTSTFNTNKDTSTSGADTWGTVHVTNKIDKELREDGTWYGLNTDLEASPMKSYRVSKWNTNCCAMEVKPWTRIHCSG